MCYAYGNIRTANIQPNPLKDGMPQFMHDVIMEISEVKKLSIRATFTNIHKQHHFGLCMIHHIYVTILSLLCRSVH